MSHHSELEKECTKCYVGFFFKEELDTCYYSHSLNAQRDGWMCDNCFKNRTDEEKIDDLEQSLRRSVTEALKKTDSSFIRTALRECEDRISDIIIEVRSMELGLETAWGV